jgi:DnaJ-class molecular chaperone
MRRKLTHYDTRGIERDASDAEVRGAFRRLALQHHPDRFSGNKRAAAEERFQFERQGYFVADLKDHSAGNPVFNRTVTLKDSWTGTAAGS